MEHSPAVEEQCLATLKDGHSSKSEPAILIVDDSLTVRMDLRESFESAGFAVTVCSTLAAARSALAQQAFSLAILDVLLPDGDGLDLLREIKSQISPAIPAIVLSTEAELRDRIRGVRTGADDYVGKPYERSYIVARARQLIRSGSVENAPRAPVVLVIDDSPTFREEFKSQMEGTGYLVRTAASGEEGLGTAFDLRPDAIIVDRMLGEGIDGEAVIRRLKQDVTLRGTPCLLLTGAGSAQDELCALESGADAYLSKDSDMKVILARVSALLRFASLPRLIDHAPSSLLGAKTILAVDDSITFLHEVCAQLRDEGYGTIEATSGKEALACLGVQRVDCILLDVRMPEVSGYEVCRIIKQRPDLRNIPLLLLTALEEPDAFVEGINSGADDYICKSGDFTILKARVRAQLRRKQFEDEYRRLNEEVHVRNMEKAQARAAQEIAEARAALVDELEKKNQELEAFAYTASHDLRAPLRSITGFTKMLLQDFSGQLPAQAVSHLNRVQAAAGRMGKLIEALLELSRSGRGPLRREQVDLSNLARSLTKDLADADESRKVECIVAGELRENADLALVRVVLSNLLSNAWKFTAKAEHARIEFGSLERAGQKVYFIRDNGAGFEPEGAKKLFQPFMRLHAACDFPGAGIGLATVRRIIERHSGEIWAEGSIGTGATFYFTLQGSGKAGEAIEISAATPSHSPAA